MLRASVSWAEDQRERPRRRPGVQTALLLFPPAPAARARILSGSHGTRAWPAADARVAAVVQRVVRDVLGADVRPHMVVGPGHQRIDLQQVERFVALDDAGGRAVLRLVTADRGHPGLEAGHRLAQRLDLAELAAAVRGALPERRTVGRGLLGDRLLR